MIADTMTMTDSPDDYLAGVEAIGPIIEDGAAAGEKARKLTDPVMDALHGAGLFRLLLPASLGGGEVDPPTYARIIEAVAKRDASAAWCLGQGNGCAMTAAYLDRSVAETVWGNDPRAVLAWGPGKGEARADGDGYRLTGSWSFASGGRHATWFGGHCVLQDAGGETKRTEAGAAITRVALIPAGDAEMTEIWDVMGLLGTGSDAFAVTDQPIAADFMIRRDDATARREDGPLYLFPTTALYAIGFSSTALGIVRPMIDAFVELAAKKTPRLIQNRLGDNAVVQTEVARAEARVGAARAFLFDELSDIWRAVLADGALTTDQRVRIRLATTHTIHEARDVVDTIYELAGTTAIFASSPFERRFRDMHTLSQQVQARRANLELVGAYMFGHPPPPGII
jgi:alkylation response protein AidB-like acyl-CoA dehydrogenase